MKIYQVISLQLKNVFTGTTYMYFDTFLHEKHSSAHFQVVH